MIVQKGPLYAALAGSKRLIDPKSSLPILVGVVIRSDAGGVAIIATDLTTWLRVAVPATGDPIAVCVPAKPLLDFVKPNGCMGREARVEIKPVDDHLVQVLLTNAETTIETLPIESFPVHPADKITEWTNDGSWDAAAFAESVSWVLPAASKDPTRPHLGGVFLDNEAVVATDGHRLHLARLEGLNAGPTLVPAKAIATLLKILPARRQIKVERGGEYLRFTVGSWELTTKIMQEQFPPYEMVIPSIGYESFHTIIETARLAQALKQLPRVPGERTQAVKVRVNGRILLERETDLGKASVELESVDSTHRGDDFEIGLDGRYVLDALAADEDLCTIRFGGALDPVRIEPGEKVAVLMPLRI